MKKIKEFLNIILNTMFIILAFIVILEITTDVIKNIKLTNKLKEDSVCIEINNDLYCKLEYDVKIEYNAGKVW